jgi:hypothetical protein
VSLRENVRRLRPKHWRQKITHRLTLPLLPGDFYQKQRYTFLFPRLRIKLEGRHFDTIEVMEAESQAVLNTFTEHDFQNALGNSIRGKGTVHTCGKGLFRGLWWLVRPKLVSDQMAAPVPEIKDICIFIGCDGVMADPIRVKCVHLGGKDSFTSFCSPKQNLLLKERDGFQRPYSRFSRPGLLLFLPSSSSVVLTRQSGPRSKPTTSQKIW